MTRAGRILCSYDCITVHKMTVLGGILVLSVYKELLDGGGEGEPVHVPLVYPVLAHGHPYASPAPGRETGWPRADSSQILHGHLKRLVMKSQF